MAKLGTNMRSLFLCSIIFNRLPFPKRFTLVPYFPNLLSEAIMPHNFQKIFIINHFYISINIFVTSSLINYFSAFNLLDIFHMEFQPFQLAVIMIRQLYINLLQPSIFFQLFRRISKWLKQFLYLLQTIVSKYTNLIHYIAQLHTQVL